MASQVALANLGRSSGPRLRSLAEIAGEVSASLDAMLPVPPRAESEEDKPALYDDFAKRGIDLQGEAAFDVSALATFFQCAPVATTFPVGNSCSAWLHQRAHRERQKAEIASPR